MNLEDYDLEENSAETNKKARHYAIAIGFILCCTGIGALIGVPIILYGIFGDFD